VSENSNEENAMPYKVFLSPTGSGNMIFEGDVVNGYTTADGSDVVIKFYSNDRGYTCGAFGRTKDKKNLDSGTPMNADGAKALRNELAELLEKHTTSVGVFKATSSQKHFTLTREVEGAPLILGVIGTDPRYGSSYHRGDAEAFKKVLTELDQVLKTIDEVKAGKVMA
jgi:hypothetical protein